MVAHKVRLRFAKHGHFRLVSHHDLMRCFERALRRADLPIAHTQGFNPRPKIVFPLAMALGIEGLREVVELELSEPLPPEEVRTRLAAVAPPGLQLLTAEPLVSRKSGQASAASYQIELPPERRAETARRLAEFLQADEWHYTRVRPNQSTQLDLRAQVVAAEIGEADRLSFRLRVNPAGSARAEDVLEALGLRDLLEMGRILVRTDVVLSDDAATAEQFIHQATCEHSDNFNSSEGFKATAAAQSTPRADEPSPRP